MERTGSTPEASMPAPSWYHHINNNRTLHQSCVICFHLPLRLWESPMFQVAVVCSFFISVNNLTIWKYHDLFIHQFVVLLRNYFSSCHINYHQRDAVTERSWASQVHQKGCHVSGMQEVLKWHWSWTLFQWHQKRHDQYHDRLSFCPTTKGISRALWSSARIRRVQQTFRFEFYLPAWLWASHLTSSRFNCFNSEIEIALSTPYHSHGNQYNDSHIE